MEEGKRREATEVTNLPWMLGVVLCRDLWKGPDVAVCVKYSCERNWNMENFQPAFLWEWKWMLHSPSISMRLVLSAFMSEWSTVERSGQQEEIKRVTDSQIYFFCLWSYTLSCLNHCGSAKWSRDVLSEVRSRKVRSLLFMDSQCLLVLSKHVKKMNTAHLRRLKKFLIIITFQSCNIHLKELMNVFVFCHCEIRWYKKKSWALTCQFISIFKWYPW